MAAAQSGESLTLAALFPAVNHLLRARTARPCMCSPRPLHWQLWVLETEALGLEAAAAATVNP